MWPFSTKTQPPPESEVPARLQALDKRIDELTAAWEKVQYEWDDWYGKFQRLHARLAKRAKDESDSTTDQDAINERILRRRHGA